MGMPQLIVTAVLVEGRSKSEVARQYGVSRRWVITLVQRYLAEGDAGLHPRSRRPLTSPLQTPRVVEEEIVAIARSSTGAGMRPVPRRSRFTSSNATAAPRRCPRSGGS
jgi:transposase